MRKTPLAAFLLAVTVAGAGVLAVAMLYSRFALYR
jgi:hypothetical protein